MMNIKKMNPLEIYEIWQTIFFVAKINAYLLAMACMIKFLWGE